MWKEAFQFWADIFNYIGKACTWCCHFANGEKSVSDCVVEGDFAATGAIEEVVTISINRFAAFGTSANGAH